MVVALWFTVPSRSLVAALTTSAATAATAVTTTTATAAWFAGLGFIYLESPAPLLLAVQSRNRRLGLRIGVHLHESEPFALPRTPVHDDFRTLDRSVCLQHCLQVRTADIIAEVPDIQFFAHRNLLSMEFPTRGFTFRAVSESGRRSGLEGR